MTTESLTQETLFKDSPAHWGIFFTKTQHTKPNASIEPSNVKLSDGYTVLVVGAGKGVGEYTAKAYVEARASNVIITARTASDLDRVKKELEDIATSNGTKLKVSTLASDASKPETYVQLKDLIETEFGGRLDCLVYNAGTGFQAGSGYGPLHETDPQEFLAGTTLNYVGAYYAARHLIPVLLDPQSVGKTIINVTSNACHETTHSPAVYNISKLALNRLTQNIGETYASQGLMCYSIHPGATMTPGTEQMPDFIRGILTDDIRLGPAVCVWLSKEQRPWASGRHITSTWDMDELESMKDDIVKNDKLKFRMHV